MLPRIVLSVLVLTGLLLAGGISIVAIAQDKTEFKRGSLTDARKGWQDYLRFAKRLQVTVTATHYEVTDGQRSTRKRSRVQIKQGDNAALRGQETVEPKTDGAVEGTNSRYSFALRGCLNRVL
jgi:hypothetical protein